MIGTLASEPAAQGNETAPRGRKRGLGFRSSLVSARTGNLTVRIDGIPFDQPTSPRPVTTLSGQRHVHLRSNPDRCLELRTSRSGRPPRPASFIAGLPLTPHSSADSGIHELPPRTFRPGPALHGDFSVLVIGRLQIALSDVPSPLPRWSARGIHRRAALKPLRKTWTLTRSWLVPRTSRFSSATIPLKGLDGVPPTSHRSSDSESRVLGPPAGHRVAWVHTTQARVSAGP